MEQKPQTIVTSSFSSAGTRCSSYPQVSSLAFWTDSPQIGLPNRPPTSTYQLSALQIDHHREKTVWTSTSSSQASCGRRCISSVRLCNIPLTWTVFDSIFDSQTYSWDVPSLVLEDLPLALSRSSLTAWTKRAPTSIRSKSSDALSLNGLISERLVLGSPDDLVSFIRKLQGNQFEFRSCPAAAVDAVLDLIATVEDETQDTSESNASWLQKLRIRGCSNFSFAKLWRAVEARDATAEELGLKPADYAKDPTVRGKKCSVRLSSEAAEHWRPAEVSYK
ncbi:hypothetical protein LshimejAT787_1701260 [Lyophyllum shimeji]|uniref:Uncharacterized protein n=1 Tax=Lyophyllum shimeji TaxID=47721 RepID=A0A9P3UQZ0_LYOSH|nr:hypothetical protein LshimejAT787_1701260 [Lyophyllum shimeji]